jgi:hypothetical protein
MSSPHLVMDGSLACKEYQSNFLLKFTIMPFAAIYTLIHAFLTKNSHTKAAQAVKKAAKEVVILQDEIDIEGPQLDEIIAQWKIFKMLSCVSTFAFPKGLS